MATMKDMNTMYWSKSFHKTYKEDPSEAEVASHKLLIRAGLVKKLASGIFTYGTLALRSLQKIEAIIRKELSAIQAQEILMPMVQPKSLWEETNRWGIPELLKLKNRNGHEFCLGATHEEVITDYVRNDVASYKELPLYFYQIQTKYRDEIRPRFGLMRGREFIMKDAYSFDQSPESARKSYTLFKLAYKKIFDRLGLEYRIVQADSGVIGGNLTEEFQVLAQTGEDVLLVSDSSDFAANKEVCPRIYQDTEGLKKGEEKKELNTPGVNTITSLSQFLKIPESHLVKTLFFKDSQQNPFSVLLRGNDEINPIKLKNALDLVDPPEMLSEAEVKQLTGAHPGSCGPQGLDIPIYADHFLKNFKSYLVGANRTGFHIQGLKPNEDFQVKSFMDLAFARSGDLDPQKVGHLQEIRGIEVGHIFYLGTKYSQSMNAKYQDPQGRMQNLEMGCYGIGIGRTMQSAIEQTHDSQGIRWPKAIAPFDFHITLLDPQNDQIFKKVQEWICRLNAQGYSVFVDDRNERPGVKFKDADLIGLPVRITLGQRGFKNHEVEILGRFKMEKQIFPIEDPLENFIEFYKSCP